jgi:hypothetical protein
MLLYIAECVTPQMLQNTMAPYGEGGRRLVEAFNVTQSGDFRHRPRYRNGLDLLDAWHTNNHIDPSTQYQDALRYILECCSTDSRFQNLALQAFDVVPDQDEVPWAGSAIPAAFLKAVQWRHAPWEIPTDAQLTTLEKVFCASEHSIELHSTYEYQCMIENMDDLAESRWFFSAAALAIYFLEQRPIWRKALRHIVLVEDRVSVSNPEAHMLGLAQFFRENTSLQVVRRVGLWSATAPFGWLSLAAHFPEDDPDIPVRERASAREIIFSLVKWINGEMTSRSAFPERTYSVVFTEYASDAWNAITRAVTLQTVMRASYQERHLNPSLRFDRRDSIRDPYSLPCHMPQRFAVAMQEFLERRTTFITFDAAHELTWDFQALLVAYGNPSPEVCYLEWKKLLEKEIDFPEGGFYGLAQPYQKSSGQTTVTLG